MALDHANSFIAHGKLEPEMWAVLFPEYRGDALTFLTRAVTHVAAPGFFFLLGFGAGLSILLIVTTELALPDARTGFVGYAPVLLLWLLPGFVPGMWVLYPVMPWLGVMGLGMVHGRWLRQDREQAYRGALWLGAAALLLFVPIRLLNGFGNIRPVQGDDWIAFFNVVKYPPAISFLLLTLGPNLLLVGLFARAAPVGEAGVRVLAVWRFL